ncbi:MAG: hypothetical protein H6684_14540 [Deltaproteobacteria bacterium]|nr:hypothetical protein [Deltaproteobacteria bacterium]MCB9478448.1 hypothetical protein [Deltaproteobacteria bacterium]MCB9489947.1 hypothetical protein [Deltaproteobacteria bacterium]
MPEPEIDLAEHQKQGARAARRVLAIILAISTVLGVYLAFQYRHTEAYLAEAKPAMREMGATSSVTQCVDRVVEWNRTCDVLESVCTAYVPAMMQECMAGQDRAAYCAGLTMEDKERTSFGFDHCETYAEHRALKKACALSYRTIISYCGTLAGGDGP